MPRSGQGCLWPNMLRRMLLLFFILTFSAGDESSVEPESHCGHLHLNAPVDQTTDLQTFVSARPSVLLDLTKCKPPALLSRKNVGAASEGSTIAAEFSQSGFDISAAVDGITDQPDNGWAFLGQLEKAFFTLHLAHGPHKITRILLISGSQREDHHITEFSISYSESDDDSWRPIPDIRLKGAEISDNEDQTIVRIADVESEIQLEFPPVSISRVRIQVLGSDNTYNSNIVLNEIEVLTDDGASGWDNIELEVQLDGEVIENLGGVLSLLQSTDMQEDRIQAGVTKGMFRIWLPSDAGIHEVSVHLSEPIDQALFAVYEKHSVGLTTYVTFPYEGFVFGRGMLPFVRLGATGWQCVGGAPVDNSTGLCWEQQFESWHSTLEILPQRSTSVECTKWKTDLDRHFCEHMCDFNYEGIVGNTRCCHFDQYAHPRRNAAYWGLACLPQGEYKLIARFWDSYTVYAAKHEVFIKIDKSDLGMWYHRETGEGKSYLDTLATNGDHEPETLSSQQAEDVVHTLDELIKHCICGEQDWLSRTAKTTRPRQCCESVEPIFGKHDGIVSRIESLKAALARGLIENRRILIPRANLPELERELSTLKWADSISASQSIEPERHVRVDFTDTNSDIRALADSSRSDNEGADGLSWGWWDVQLTRYILTISRVQELEVQHRSVALNLQPPVLGVLCVSSVPKHVSGLLDLISQVKPATVLSVCDEESVSEADLYGSVLGHQGSSVSPPRWIHLGIGNDLNPIYLLERKADFVAASKCTIYLKILAPLMGLGLDDFDKSATRREQVRLTTLDC